MSKDNESVEKMEQELVNLLNADKEVSGGAKKKKTKKSKKSKRSGSKTYGSKRSGSKKKGSKKKGSKKGSKSMMGGAKKGSKKSKSSKGSMGRAKAYTMEGGKKKSKTSGSKKGSKKGSKTGSKKVKRLPPALVEFRKVIQLAEQLLGKKGKPAMQLAGIANKAAKAKLGDTAPVEVRTKEALALLNANFNEYKKKAGL